MTNASIVAALRAGVVPAQGLELFATGLDAIEAIVLEELDFVATGEGSSKWLRGEYGAGKTFTARYLCARARAHGFATTEVQISINDTPLHHLETIYRRLIDGLHTREDGPNAFRAIVEAWLNGLANEVLSSLHLAEDAPGLLPAVEARLEDELSALSKRNPAFAQGLRAFHRARHEADFVTARGALGWLAGQPHIAPATLKAAGVTGKVDGQAALTFLGGLLLLLRQSGHKGLVVVLDEVETLQRMQAQNREKALNVLRQLLDALAARQLPGLYLVVTGTRDLFESYKGVKALAPLAQRVSVDFTDDERFDNLRAPQLRLAPFTLERLITVGQRVRALYPAKNPARLTAKVTDAFLEQLVRSITAGLSGQISLSPRLFLRKLVDVMDRVDQHETYEPAAHYELKLEEAELNDEELHAFKAVPFRGPRLA